MFISFSPFDQIDDILEINEISKELKFKYIGVNNTEEKNEEVPILQNSERYDYHVWNRKFKANLKNIQKDRGKLKLFLKQIQSLQFITNELFEAMEFKTNNSDLKINKILKDLRDEDKLEKLFDRLTSKFKKMSSGEKIVTLGTAALVANVEEKTLVLFDEPELYLHPPLLSNYIRIISDIMDEKNGLAILVTHSPIVLQEIPNDCIYITSNSRIPELVRPKQVTFGENVSILTHEVFGLDIENSGFYVFLEKYFENNYRGNKSKIIELYDSGKLGAEGRFHLDILMDAHDEFDTEGE